MEGNEKYIGDTVPVDCVVGNIIVATAFNAFSKQLSIYHVGSSDRNPTTWKEAKDIVKDFWEKNPSNSQVSKPNVIMTNNYLKIKKSQVRR